MSPDEQRRVVRNIFSTMGAITLIGATVSVAASEPTYAVALAVVALVWFIGARIAF